MSKVLRHLPEIDGDEQIAVARLLQSMTDAQAEQFAHVYRSRRKDPTLVLAFSLVGFLGVAGVQRFYLDQVGLGLVYLLTWGFCGLGTLIDAVRYKSIALTYNRERANEVAELVRATSSGDPIETGGDASTSSDESDA